MFLLLRETLWEGRIFSHFEKPGGDLGFALRFPSRPTCDMKKEHRGRLLPGRDVGTLFPA